MRLRPHLFAAALAAVIAGVVGAVSIRVMDQEQADWAYALAPETAELKNQTVAWQAAAFSRDDLLPLYGSSEMVGGISTCASRFFAKRPTGFIVSPVGRGASTSLIIAQRIAAAAPGCDRSKVAVIVSPSWFMTPSVPLRRYAGNFSPYQAHTFVFCSPLSLQLKRDLARRLLDYEETLTDYPVLHFAVRQLAQDGLQHRALYYATVPLGTLHNLVFSIQARGQLADYIRSHPPARMRPMRKTKSMDWEELIAQAEKATGPVSEKIDGLPIQFASDASFRTILQESPEWSDLELLLRTVRELRLDTLLLVIPIERPNFEAKGISRESLDLYYKRMKSLADRYRVKIEDSSKFQDDPYFFEDHHDHISAKAWMVYNQKIDRFFHQK